MPGSITDRIKPISLTRANVEEIIHFLITLRRKRVGNLISFRAGTHVGGPTSMRDVWRSTFVLTGLDFDRNLIAHHNLAHVNHANNAPSLGSGEESRQALPSHSTGYDIHTFQGPRENKFAHHDWARRSGKLLGHPPLVRRHVDRKPIYPILGSYSTSFACINCVARTGRSADLSGRIDWGCQ